MDDSKDDNEHEDMQISYFTADAAAASEVITAVWSAAGPIQTQVFISQTFEGPGKSISNLKFLTQFGSHAHFNI